VRLEQVDGNGLLPLRATARAYPTPHAFRRFLQKALPEHLAAPPHADPLHRAGERGRAVVPRHVLQLWPMAPAAALDGTHPPWLPDPAWLRSLPIGRVPAPVAQRGGAAAAQRALERFLDEKLARYGEQRNQPEADAQSGLSPYLHFGHLSPHQVLAGLAEREAWTAERLGAGGGGSREGWWGMSPSAEAFLDELVTWRELGYGFAFHRPDDYDRFESLPGWALATLRAHAADPRPHVYDLDALEAGRTHDPLWNAAQAQLARDGRIHGYLRMLWGKKILEWSPTPQAALAAMIELNNKYALDGRDPNSYSGIFWTLGRFDRPWWPERPIFGVVRFMSSASTARKLRVKRYVEAQLRAEGGP
jgi:deoxyribodipyrimidine photo-lyase